MVRIAFVLLACTGLCAQCDDIEVSARRAKHFSDVVFRGTVEEFRGSGADRTAVFHVNRVWKGPVGPVFEMPAVETDGGLCTAFWRGLLVRGNELVVYAKHYPWARNRELLPLRSKSTLVTRAEDINQLGRGHKPK